MVLSKDIDKIHQSPNFNFNLGIRRLSVLKVTFGKFPGGPVIKTSVLSAGATGLIPNRGVKGEGNGTPLQYCCPENPMDRGAW